MEKHCAEGQATDDNMVHTHCKLDTYCHKYTHSGCVILIAFPLQQWWYERASILRYMPIACLVVNCTRAVGERAHNNGPDPLQKKKKSWDTPTFDDVI